MLQVKIDVIMSELRITGQGGPIFGGSMEKAPENRISETELDQLIAAHDGDVALLYLYLRRRGGDLDAAARTLCRTGAAMRRRSVAARSSAVSSPFSGWKGSRPPLTQ